MIKIKNLDRLSEDKKIQLLRTIIENLNLGCLMGILKDNKINGRTRILKAFKHPYYYNKDNDPTLNYMYTLGEKQIQERNDWTIYLKTFGLSDQIINAWISASQGYNIFVLLNKHIDQPIQIEYINESSEISRIQ